ncbi:hypothetical protein GLOIN_2v1792123 [Rhizophagus irregularis DAOM 181602=DAOM 197198]|uniref:BTB domain-containing protein n=1 Tax=Rhizophagus irregularis (strain DAOM 181602 / DAOM 197198 / MUCL 43194) TaxID=747089 RepID=A0A2P4NLF2_RHIID|nr:hypothetical protein GLOIN_2v1792123 [Rhizophagus irregularis DAOM 181602=DAOM 197198]POG53972.1 hypothetical protein GLOIN_2v1792123 [Rhizophagus irregularis DAOM 181602=DAOM 197198]|eukprot:XP_025164209.1 hypothetical protein GLOIN_2v1792123 [Rhizophagus irregularis DAOM 181602=DAOM 197198]
MTYHFETEVTKALEQLLKTETDYNVIIYAGKKHDSKKKDEKYVIYKLNISPQVFDVILKYLYAGYVDITDKIGTELLNIIIASDKLYLENLTRFTKDYIVEHRQLLQNDPVGALQTGATIIVLKIKNSEGIIGGYNPLEWDSTNGSFKHTKDSFLFSFINKKNGQMAKVGYSNGNKYSITSYDNPCSYPKLDGIPKGTFDMDDFEVFQVIKKTKKN